jgi:hypothetical protein
MTNVYNIVKASLTLRSVTILSVYIKPNILFDHTDRQEILRKKMI